MTFFVLTLFPQIISDAVDFSILKRAKEKNFIEIVTIDIRKYACDKHKTTDLPPYGGGPGMILKPEPIFLAIEDLFKSNKLNKKNTKVVLLSAAGDSFNQKKAEEYTTFKNIILICGHYEGVDQRVADNLADEEISIGNYVLSGGEYASLIIIDSVSRLIKGVLGNEDSSKKESFENGMLEHPQYTRPADFRGLKVPEVLTEGDHKKIEDWKNKNSRYVPETTSSI